MIQRRKVFWLFTGVIFATFLIFKVHPTAMDHTVDHLTVLKEKFVNMTKDSRMLENILKASYKPQYNGKTIFFIDSGTKEDKTLSLSPKQACSIEAAGILEIQENIFVDHNFLHSQNKS